MRFRGGCRDKIKADKFYARGEIYGKKNENA